MVTIFEPLYFLKLFQILSARLSLYSQDTLIAFESVEFWPPLKKLHNLTTYLDSNEPQIAMQ